MKDVGECYKPSQGLLPGLTAILSSVLLYERPHYSQPNLLMQRCWTLFSIVLMLPNCYNLFTVFTFCPVSVVPLTTSAKSARTVNVCYCLFPFHNADSGELFRSSSGSVLTHLCNCAVWAVAIWERACDWSSERWCCVYSNARDIHYGLRCVLPLPEHVS